MFLVHILRQNVLFFLLIFSKNADFDKYKYYGYGVGFDAPKSFSLSIGNNI